MGEPPSYPLVQTYGIATLRHLLNAPVSAIEARFGEAQSPLSPDAEAALGLLQQVEHSIPGDPEDDFFHPIERTRLLSRYHQKAGTTLADAIRQSAGGSKQTFNGADELERTLIRLATQSKLDPPSSTPRGRTRHNSENLSSVRPASWYARNTTCSQIARVSTLRASRRGHSRGSFPRASPASARTVGVRQETLTTRRPTRLSPATVADEFELWYRSGAADGLVADRAVAAVIFQWSKFFVKCSSGGASVVEMLVQVDRELVQQGVAGPLAALPPIHRHCLSRRTLLSTAKADSTEYSQDGNAR